MLTKYEIYTLCLIVFCVEYGNFQFYLYEIKKERGFIKYILYLIY